MTGTGRSRVGHFHRDANDYTSKAFCGRTLGGGFFTDEASKPTVCKRCMAAAYKQGDTHHHHEIFIDGRWIVRFIDRPRWYTVYGNGAITEAFTRCPHPGCERSVPNHVQPMMTNTGSGTTTTLTWAWAA